MIDGASLPASDRTPADLLRAALAADPARPLLTFHDDATGERVELSVATFDNWVAKTANLMQDDWAVEPGARVALLLPLHWQTAVWLAACWAVGAVAVPDGDPASCDAVVAGPDRLAEAAACAGERMALALRPLGGRFPQPPAGFADYAVEVPSHGDRFTPYAPVRPQEPALDLQAHLLTGGQLTALAADQAEREGVRPGDRTLSALPMNRLDGLLAGLLVPLATGGSAVLCRNLESADEATLRRRVEQERVTRVLR
ncbi:TIGR03089 family protein [Allostreptomyces psammosilenae]|nr:TIGR03089 family protein [Allostreptomyces psammosilenae]